MKIVTITGNPFQRHGYIVHTLAEWMARKRIKESWRASGHHPHDLGRAELNRAASVYLLKHEELFAEAKAMIARDPVLTKMAAAEAKRYLPSKGAARGEWGALVCAESKSDAQRKSR
jgi:hypothetical protein